MGKLINKVTCLVWIISSAEVQPKFDAALLVHLFSPRIVGNVVSEMQLIPKLNMLTPVGRLF